MKPCVPAVGRLGNVRVHSVMRLPVIYCHSCIRLSEREMFAPLLLKRPQVNPKHCLLSRYRMLIDHNNMDRISVSHDT